MMEQFLNEAWEREIFKLLVGVFLFAIGFLSSSLREFYSERRTRKSEKLFFETRLLKLLGELNIYLDTNKKKSNEDSNIFSPKYTFLDSYTLKELKLVDQIKLFHLYVGKAKKKKRKLVGQDFDLMMLSLDNVSRVYKDAPKYSENFIQQYAGINEEWNEAMRNVDELFSEIIGITQISPITEMGFATKFMELRKKVYEDEAKKGLQNQFSIESVYRYFVAPLRVLVGKYASTKYAQRLNPSLIRLEESYRNYQTVKFALIQSDIKIESELKEIRICIAKFVTKYSQSNLKKHGY